MGFKPSPSSPRCEIGVRCLPKLGHQRWPSTLNIDLEIQIDYVLLSRRHVIDSDVLREVVQTSGIHCISTERIAVAMALATEDKARLCALTRAS